MRRFVARSMSVLVLLFALLVLFPVSLLSQNQTPQPDDSTASAVQGRARPVPSAGAQQRAAQGVEQDDPGLRVEWEKKAWGTANPEFRRHSLREAAKHNQRLGRTSGGGAEAGVSLNGASTPNLTPSAPASGPAWISLGPTGADSEQNGSFTGLFRDSGRARTVLPHPTDPNILYFLTSGGGLWKTTNFESSSTTWTPLTDNLPTTGGGAVAFGRTPSVLYLGLGDPYDQILVGGAMVKSTDGGQTWSPMIELGNAVSVRAVAVDISGANDIIMVATEIGVYRSIDSGATYSGVGGVFSGKAVWSIVQTSAGWLASAQTCSVSGELCNNPTTLYLSIDAGATWNPISNAGNIFNGNGRTTLGVGLPGDAVVYAYSSTIDDSQMRDVYRSSDGGQTWVANGVNSTKTPTNPVPSDMPDMNICHGQCWYNQMILVDPTDATRKTVYIGGDLGTARTTDGGTTWTITTWWLYHQVPSLPYAHADFHAAAFKSTGTPAILFGSDGGLFMSTDNAATFTSDKNNGLVTHLFYTITGTPSLPNLAMGGTQDDGTRIRKGNSSIFDQVMGGDGLGASFSQANTNTSFASAEFSALLANLSGIPTEVFQDWVSATSGIVTGEAGFSTDIFAPAGSLDPTGRVFFTFTNTRVYKTTDGGLNWSTIAQVNTGNGLPAGRTFRSTAYNLGVSPLDLNRIVMGAAGGFIDISTNGGTSWVDLDMKTLVPGYAGFVSNVTWADNKTIWVAAAAQATGSKRVIQGTIANAGNSWTTATWVVKDSGLPDLPVTKLLLDPRDGTKNTLYAATHVGVYRTTDGGTSWQPYGTNLPNVRVADMYMPPDGGYLRIASYGRGIWEIPQLEYVSAAINDDVVSCNSPNGILDEGETGHLTITLHNQGSNALNNTTATVTSSNPHVTFPSGNSVAFPPAAGFSDTVASVEVALHGASGVETTDFTISFTDSGLSVASPLSVVSTQRLNYDEVAFGTTTDTFESSTSPWTTSGTSPVFPDIQSWRRVEIAPLQHVWNGPDNNGQTSGSSGVGTDNSLISPHMSVGSNPLSISFSHRYSFEGGAFDGGVVEISTDNGATWTDIGGAAYGGGSLVAGDGSNPLGVRAAFVNSSAGWPNFITATLNLGTTYAGKTIEIRFRVGADDANGAPGWDVDNVSITGLTANPFVALNPHNRVCATSGQLSSSQNPSAFGQQITLTANVSGGVSTATGNVDFKEGSNVLGSSGLDGNGQAHLSISTLSLGAHSLTANYAGDSTHAADISNTVVQNVSQATPTVTVNCPGGVTFDGNPHSCTATATGAGGAAVSGSFSLTYGGGPPPSNAGTYPVSASFTSSDANYTNATGSGTLIIGKASQTITFGALAGKTFGDADFGVSATGGASGNAVTFGASGNCSVTGSTVHITGAGSCTITASQASNANYNAAPDVPQTFAITKAGQTITFGALANKTFGDPDFSVSATASSGLVVTFSALGNCSVTGSTVHVTGAGSCTVTASQAGDTNYSAATDVPQTFAIAKASQTITFGALVNKTFGDPDFSVSSTASSGLVVTFSALGNCSVTGSTVHITGAGSCTITASQAGDTNYNAATDVPQSFTIAKGSQTITFGALANKNFGDPDFTVSATASSGLAVTFAASGNCTVTGSTVHLTGAGSCTITASQAGNVNYNAAADVPQSFTIAKGNQTITFGALANKTFGDPDFTVSATASSGLAVTFAAGGSCTVTGSTVHISAPGSCTITASQAGNANFNPAADVPQSFTIAKASQTITFGTLATKTFGDPDFAVGASASSGLTVNFAASGNCSISGSTVHITGAGSCTITASQAGDTDYNAATDVPQSFTIAKAGQTITFGALVNKTFGDPDFGVSASATSGLAVTFSAGGSCSVTGSTVHLTGAGSCTITASQPGDTNYKAAADVPQSFTIAKAGQTITFGLLANKNFGDPDFGVSASATSGLAVTFSALGNCTVAGSTVHLTGAGSCTITASQAGDTNYNAAADVPQSFTIAKGSQTVTFGPLANKTFGDPDFAVSATASSGLAVTFAAAGNCSISGSTVHIISPGSCTITASQAGNANYNAATDVPQSFTISKASQTIAFAALANKTFGDPDFSVSATASSGLAVTFSAGGNCTVTGSTVHLTSPGSCTITASQAGDANYNPAVDVPQSFSIAKIGQTIAFGALASKTFGDPDFMVSATASSGLAVSFSSAGNCSVTGSTVHITGAGSCTVTASQPGDATYNAAPDMPQTFSIAKANQTITFGALAGKTFGDPDFGVSATASSGLAVTFSASGKCSVSGSSVHITGAGSCTVTASQAGGSNFNPAADVPQSFTIGKAGQTITFGALQNKLVGDPDFNVSASASSGLAVTFGASGVCSTTGSAVHLNGAGTCTITASQGGDSNYNAAANVPQSFTVSNPDFTIASTLPSVNVKAGQSATEHITFTPNPGISNPLAFACSGLPALSNCAFSPSTVPAGSTQVDVVLTIATTVATADLARPRTFYAAWLPLGLGLFGIVVMGRRGRGRKLATGFATLVFIVVLLVGCGGRPTPNPGSPGTPPGTYTITVTGTSGNVTRSATFNLTVN